MRKKLNSLRVGDRFRFPRKQNVNTVVSIYDVDTMPVMAYKSKERFRYVFGDDLNKYVIVDV